MVSRSCTANIPHLVEALKQAPTKSEMARQHGTSKISHHLDCAIVTVDQTSPLAIRDIVGRGARQLSGRMLDSQSSEPGV